MNRMELRKNWGYLVLLSVTLSAIPLSAHLLPGLSLKQPGGDFPVFVMIFGFSVLLVIHQLAYSLFCRERRTKAFEYYLTLPWCKWRLLGWKIGTRLMMAFPFWVTYMILARFYLHDPFFDEYLFFMNHPVYMQFTLLFMLGGGFFTSLHEQRNWGALVFLLLFYDLVLGTVALDRLLADFGLTPIHRHGLAFAASVLFCMALLMVPFLTVFKRSDLRSFYGERVLKVLTVPLLGVFFVAAVLGVVLL